MCLRISIFASFPYRLPLQMSQAFIFSSLLLSFHKINPHANSLPPLSVVFFFNLVDMTFDMVKLHNVRICSKNNSFF